MTDRTAKKEPEKPSPRVALAEAFNSLETPIVSEYASNFEKIKADTKLQMLQMRSAYTEASTIPPVKSEVPDYIVVYTKLHFTKPMYRKIELLAQLNDQGFTECLLGLVEAQVEAELDNLQELGSQVKARILESAYGVDKVSQATRPKLLTEALEHEKHK